MDNIILKKSIIFNKSPKNCLPKKSIDKLTPYLNDLNLTLIAILIGKLDCRWDCESDKDMYCSLARTYYLFEHIMNDTLQSSTEFDYQQLINVDKSFQGLFNSLFCLSDGTPYILSDNLLINLKLVITNFSMQNASDIYEIYVKTLLTYNIDPKSTDVDIDSLASYIDYVCRIQENYYEFNDVEKMICDYLGSKKKNQEWRAKNQEWRAKILVQEEKKSTKPTAVRICEDGFEIQAKQAKIVRNLQMLQKKVVELPAESEPRRVVGQAPAKVEKKSKKSKKPKKSTVPSGVAKFPGNPFAALSR